MEVEVLATLLGVALAALVAACGAGFRWLRSDCRDLRNHVDTRFDEQATHFERLEAKVDNLIMALARSGSLIDPRPPVPQPPPLTPQPSAAAQPPDPIPAPNEATAESPPPSENPDRPRAPPATGGQASAEQPYRPSPPEPFGPTTTPA